jgi:hypothetical protein
MCDRMQMYNTYYRRCFTIYYYLNCYMFRLYDHLQVEIYLLGFTRLNKATNYQTDRYSDP